MDVHSELVPRLPDLFARDLNATLAQATWPKRLVPFFDTHDAFWGADERQRLSTDSFFQRDEWVRRLLGAPLAVRPVASTPRVTRWCSARATPKRL